MLKRRSVLTLTAIIFVASAADLRGQTQPVQVTLDQFRQLRWIEGTWRGSGGNYPSFFEQYEILNDSTIRMRAFSDSTLRVVTDSSTIDWRNGKIASRRESRSYDAIEFTPTSIRFIRPGLTTGGHTWTWVGPNEWTAALYSSRQPPVVTIYTMRRFRR